ncbi:uncharacterized protein BDZ99DRAFT_550666 [Mytilinidion resinicola]|uniref:Heterokaryon incompatibility domain-containing protein n=1 Tax=Mytilinidion resinicola TaxID=574789 RepID=A0A6A6Y1R6_9PEZI|nr:uncharacterized protein BDZ99DRAFT_550666 [Mytilinidion resinicola]KAF2802761.1 hypothetical protein BDZ99DRAFT_550666 [Mytilinidion resinicola]
MSRPKEPSKFNNFYTPRNTRFYSSCPYKKLDRSRHEIRLLKAKEPLNPSTLEFELIQKVAVPRYHGKYSTVSYHSGNPHNTAKLLIDGRTFNAFRNLRDALQRLIRFWAQKFPGKELHIWADQVCINQTVYAYPLFSPEWNDIYDLLESSWWERAWVYQEFIVSRRAYFMSGLNFCVPWSELCTPLSNFMSMDIQKACKENNKAFTRDQKYYSECIRVLELEEFTRRVEMSRKAKETAEAVVNGKRLWKGSCDLSILMRHSRNCQSSEMRDKVYAFLGLTHPEYGIVPNYTSSTSIVKLLTHTARRIIEVERNLDILSDAVRLRSATYGTQLPSWVPDWTIPEDNESRLFRQTINLPPDCQASKGAPPSFRFRADDDGSDGQVLEVQAVFIDSLTAVTRDDYQSWCEFRTSKGRTIRTTSSADIGDEIWVICGVRFPFVLRK